MDPPERQLQQRLLADVPLGLRRGEPDPSTLPFNHKQEIFEKLAKQYEPPTPLQEAKVRAELEESLRAARSIRKRITEDREKPAKHLRREAERGRPAPSDGAAGEAPTKRRRARSSMVSTPADRLRPGDVLIVQEERPIVNYDTRWMEVGHGMAVTMAEVYAQMDFNSSPCQDREIVNEDYTLADYIDDLTDGTEGDKTTVYDTIELHQSLWGVGSVQARPDQLKTW